MVNRTLISLFTLAFIAFSAPRGAAAFDFVKSDEPLLLASAPAVPESPAPAPEAPKTCKPFLISLSVGGVSENVILERSCTPENAPVWALMVQRVSGDKLSVKVSSDKYPADRVKLENRIKSMALDGLKQADADFIVIKTGAALKQADALTTPREKIRALAAATEELKTFLARP